MSKKQVKAPAKKAGKVKSGWNERFVFGQIPEYVGEELPKHTVTIITEKDPKKVKGVKKPQPPEVKLSDESLSSLKLKLEEAWEANQVPNAQREPFQECLETLKEDHCKSVIIKELEDISKSKCNTILALRAVAAREESLKSVKEMQEYLQSSPDWEKLKEIQLEAAELLHAHRMLTLNAIEGIVKWRSQLSETFGIKPINFTFLWEGENYLLKLRNDLDFLFASEYAKVLNFTDEPDPLLVYPSIPAGKLEKSRKRDANYFINDGKAVVPLPSTLTGRVKDAEDVVRKEWDWIRFLEESDPKRLAEVFGPEICEEFVNQVVDEYLNELQIETQREKDEYERMMKLQKENDELAERIYNDLFGELSIDLQRIAEDEYLAAKALHESLIQQKKAEDDKLARLIYKALKDELIQFNLGEISEAMIAELQKEEEEDRSVYERGNIIEEMGLDFANIEAFNDLNGVMWIPIGLNEEFIQEALEEYYRFIPSTNKEAVPDIETLLVEVTKAIDTRWYWAIRNKVIFALLVFSIDCYSKTGRKLIVHHISSLYWKALPAIIESATAHLWKIDPCDEARISLFAPLGKELTPEIKKIMNVTKYKWKSEYELKESSFAVTVFGRMRPNGQELPAVMPFKLKTHCCLHATDSRIPCNFKTCPEMGQIGNRQIFLNSLLGLIGRLEKAEIKITQKPGTELQKETCNILNLMNQTQNFSFPNMKSVVSGSQEEINEFCSELKLSPCQIIGNRTSISSLDIKFRWISCTNTVQYIKGANYKYMRFKSSDIEHTRLEDTELIRVPTELPNISAFFLQNNSLTQEINENVGRQLDMFCLTEKLLVKGEKAEFNEVWVPCFKKSAKYMVPWIEGYELIRQTEEEKDSFIEKCDEETMLEINQEVLKEGLLVLGKKSGPVLMKDFIFGLMYTKGDKILDIPLFCCLVQAGDWIKA